MGSDNFLRKGNRLSGTESVSFFVAFAAGLLSFLSPCVLPLIPSYVSFLTGMSMDEVTVHRRAAVMNALFFVLGFTLIFMAFGASATLLGRYFNYYKDWFARIGGVLILLFGLYLLGVLKIPFLARQAKFEFRNKPMGYAGSVVVGVAFGAGWTPCIGPILASILALASVQGSVTSGVALLGTYSLGLAVPFLIAAFALEGFLNWFQKFRKYIGYVERFAGGLLVVLGLLLITGYFTILASWLNGLTPQFLLDRL